MNDYFKEEWLALIDGWTIEQLDEYIEQLEERIKYTRTQIQLLKALQKKKKRSTLETGTRGGK